MSELGQKLPKWTVRVMAGTPIATTERTSRHVSNVPISGSRGLLDQIAGAARPDGASLWKSCFAEAVDIHLSLPLTGMGYPFRYSEMGLNLKDLGHRLPGFCISP